MVLIADIDEEAVKFERVSIAVNSAEATPATPKTADTIETNCYITAINFRKFLVSYRMEISSLFPPQSGTPHSIVRVE